MSERTKLSVLYRGPLSSCNYGCEYCPFAKRVETRDELAVDRAALERFLAWAREAGGDVSERSAPGPRSGRAPGAECRPKRAKLAQAGEATRREGARSERTDYELAVFFTPWGEALIRSWYQEALVELSRLPHVRRAAIQTNLSARLEFLSGADVTKLGFWCTYHPEWTTRERFLEQCRRLDDAGAAYSVGVVGFPAFLDEARRLRDALPASVYLWVNAVKAERYTEDQLRAFAALDPLFRLNTVHWPSRGERCRAGHEVVSVDGDGTIRRCHFIREPIGNLYEDDLASVLAPRPCTNETCHCHIGYAHLEYLQLDQIFGSGILERVPAVPLRRLPLV